MEKIISLFFALMVGVLTFSLTSCKEASVEPFDYETVYCKEQQASTEIAMVDGKLYCKWLEECVDEQGVSYDVEHVDVMDVAAGKREWKRLSESDEIQAAMLYFDKPVNYEIGKYTVYLDEHNDYYLLDAETNTKTNLQLNLVDWRRFATDNTMYFAVLSAFGSAEYDGVEIRIYKLNQN